MFLSNICIAFRCDQKNGVAAGLNGAHQESGVRSALREMWQCQRGVLIESF